MRKLRRKNDSTFCVKQHLNFKKKRLSLDKVAGILDSQPHFNDKDKKICKNVCCCFSRKFSSCILTIENISIILPTIFRFICFFSNETLISRILNLLRSINKCFVAVFCLLLLFHLLISIYLSAWCISTNADYLEGMNELI